MSIEEKYDEVRQLISIGKEKGYLLYDEVNELLPADITSSDELDDLFSTFGSAGIEVVDSEKAYRDDKLLDRTGEGAEELELDLTPGALDKTNDPVRMYLREMGTVPLLTREGEVEIAKRIERGKLAVIKSISRTPTVAHAIMAMGDQLKNDERERPRAGDLPGRGDHRRQDRGAQAAGAPADRGGPQGVRSAIEKCKEKLEKTPKGATTREKRKYRRTRWEALRARVELSQLMRKIEFTETRQAAADRPAQGGGRRRDAPQAGGRSHRAAAEPEEQEGPAQGRRQEEPPQAAEGRQAADEGGGRASSRRRPIG